MASAAALPGQAMYPFKLAIEQLRLASVQWSPSREAGERTRIADERLDEVQSLLNLRIYNQLPGAIKALNRAVVAARAAVAQAQREGEPVPGVVARLGRVVADGGQVIRKVVAVAANPSVGLSDGTADAIQDAVQQSPAVKPPDLPVAAPSDAPPTPTPTSPASPGGGSDPAPTTAPTSPPTSPPTTNPPETSTSVAPTTTTSPPTTDPPTTPPPATEDTATPESIGGAAAQAGAGQAAPLEQVPDTTLP
jgi:hypothetical protein